jgi:hypothetical protein
MSAAAAATRDAEDPPTEPHDAIQVKGQYAGLLKTLERAGWANREAKARASAVVAVLSEFEYATLDDFLTATRATFGQLALAEVVGEEAAQADCLAALRVDIARMESVLYGLTLMSGAVFPSDRSATQSTLEKWRKLAASCTNMWTYYTTLMDPDALTAEAMMLLAVPVALTNPAIVHEVWSAAAKRKHEVATAGEQVDAVPTRSVKKARKE